MSNSRRCFSRNYFIKSALTHAGNCSNKRFISNNKHHILSLNGASSCVSCFRLGKLCLLLLTSDKLIGLASFQTDKTLLTSNSTPLRLRSPLESCRRWSVSSGDEGIPAFSISAFSSVVLPVNTSKINHLHSCGCL